MEWVWSLEVVQGKAMRVIHSLAKAETGEFRTLCAMTDWKGKLGPDCIGPWCQLRNLGLGEVRSHDGKVVGFRAIPLAPGKE